VPQNRATSRKAARQGQVGKITTAEGGKEEQKTIQKGIARRDAEIELHG